MALTAWIVGEEEESIDTLITELNALGYGTVYYGDEVSFLNEAANNVSPDVLFVNTTLLTDQAFSGHVRSLYPDIPVIVLCEHEELLFALEEVGSKADNYLVRSIEYEDRIKSAIAFACYRIEDPLLHEQEVRWMHSRIPQAILDVANVMFFVNYEDPDSQVNSQVKRSVNLVFKSLDEDISKRLLNVLVI